MYEDYWGLKEKPFENTPDPHFLYYSSKHEEALSRMLYAIRERKGAAILSGEYGSGKTILSRVLLEELNKERYQTVLIFNPRIPPIEFLQEIVYQLGGNDASESKTKLLRILNEILYNNRNENKSTIIAVDEAQAIESEEIFEELRLLLNFQLDDMFLLTLLLLGQPELKEKVDMIPQLRQRMAVRYHLMGLDEWETREYIIHRLEVAGLSEKIFAEGTYELIHEACEGIPRRINNICDMCLLAGFGAKVDRIDEGIVKDVIGELEESPVEIGEKKR